MGRGGRGNAPKERGKKGKRTSYFFFIGVWVSYDDVIDVIISALQTPRLGFFTLNVVSQNPIRVYDDQNWGVFDFDPRPFPADAKFLDQEIGDVVE